MFNRLATLVERRPRIIVVVAAAFAVVAGTFGGSVADSLKPFGFDDPASESVRARETLERATGANPDRPLIAVVSARSDVLARRARTKVERIASRIRREPLVAEVLTTYSTRDRAMISKDGKSTYVLATFKAAPDRDVNEAAKALKEAFAGDAQVTLGGGALASAQIGDTVESDLVHGEMLAFPILFLLSFWVFRGLVAAALPLLVGGLTIVTTFLGLRLIAGTTELSIFALNLVTGLGLGLSIDYSLFILSRYREEIARTGPGIDAMRRALNTAGRTVLFSGVTVAGALASLLVFPQRFLYSMGVGGSLVAIAGVIVALVVLPAVLALLGGRVNALSPERWQRAIEASARPASAGPWYRLSRFVMRRPAPIAAAAAALLIALGIPFLNVRFTQADATVLPKSASARQVHDILERRFPPHRTTPNHIVVDVNVPRARAAAARLERYARSLRGLAGAESVVAPRKVGTHVWRIDVIPDSAARTQRSQDLVRELRSRGAPYPIEVGGSAAALIDQKRSLADHLPYALAIVVLVTLLVLFLMTGSVVLPVKAVIMNVLTVSAAFGILVFVFQDGRLQRALDYTSQGALDMSQPILLAVIAFGLSTDYGVFLLTRIKEARDGGAGERESVALGLQRTGRIVTAAALLFCVAVSAFATSRLIFIKEVGIGTGLAVVIDATIVRAFLVPSLMALLGRWNWWAPGPLRRLHARLGLGEPTSSL